MNQQVVVMRYIDGTQKKYIFIMLGNLVVSLYRTHSASLFIGFHLNRIFQLETHVDAVVSLSQYAVVVRLDILY